MTQRDNLRAPGGFWDQPAFDVCLSVDRGPRRLLMVVSIAAFVVAAVLGLLANIWSNDQPEVPDNRLHELLDNGPWRDTDAVEGARTVAQEVERNIQEYRRGNRRSLRRIRLAVCFEILAAALLASSVGWLVFTG